MRKRFEALLCISIVLLFVYKIGFWQCYLISDDYFLFYDINGANVYLSGGRGVAYLISEFYRDFYGHYGINSVWLLRVIALGGIMALGYSLYTIFYKYRLGHYFSIFLSCLVINIPCFLLYVIWVTCNPFVFGAIFAVLAYACSMRALKFQRSFGYRLFYSLMSVFLLIVSLSTYQPSAMLFFSLIVLDLFQMKTNDLARLIKIPAYKVGLGFFSMGLYFVIFKLSIYIFKIPINSRSSFPDSYIGKIIFFWQSVFPISINVFNIHPTGRSTIGLIILFVLAMMTCFVMMRPRLKVTAFRLISLPLLLMVSYTPNLMTKDNFPAYRTLLGPTAIIVIVFVMSYQMISRRWSQYARYSLMVLSMAYMCIHDNHLITKYLVYPATYELNYITNYIYDKYVEKIEATDKIKEIVYIPIQDGGGMVNSNLQRFGEFGASPTSHQWSAKYSVMLALDMLGLDSLEKKIKIQQNRKLVEKSDTIVINMNTLNYFQYQWRF